MSTLTFVYDDSTAVLGPLSKASEPHAYDLCAEHASRLTAPKGWRLIRVPGASDVPDELVALAEAVRPGRDSREGDEAGAGTGTGAGDNPDARRADTRSGDARSAGARSTGARTGSASRHLQVIRSDDE